MEYSGNGVNFVKIVIKILISLFSALFITLLLLSLKTLTDFSLNQESSRDRPDYSYAFFLPALDYPFFNSIKQGAMDCAQELNCTISFYQVDLDQISLEMMPFSGMDGVALYPHVADDSFRELMKPLWASSLPLVYLEHNLSRSSTYYVGTNSFEVGNKIGELVRAKEEDSLSCALVFSEKSPGLLADRTLVEMGFRQILGDRFLREIYFEQTDRNPLDAENLVYRLLKEHPNLDTLIFTDPKDTLAAVQVIVDRNLVGKVDIIGFGDDPAILDNISRGIISGTLVRDPYRIGYSAVEILKGISERGNASAYVDIGIRLISPVNIRQAAGDNS
jgi:ribose transport system substrate-binding protein